MSKAMHTDIAIIGAGPAGIAAAIRASESGQKVCIIDENQAGGQIWRHDLAGQQKPEARKWLERLAEQKVEWIQGRVLSRQSERKIYIELKQELKSLHYKKLILATGAREQFLPFPGWTLPGVFGLGGLQALVKGGWPIKGKRVALAGSGPLMLAVAESLKQRGADLVIMLEQTPKAKLNKMAFACLGHPAKLWQGIQLKWNLKSVPYYADSWPIEAKGNGHIESLSMSVQGQIKEIDCDMLACGFGLVPNLELAEAMKISVEAGKKIETYGLQQTSDEHIYAAGEACGIGGVECALIEGEMAGLAASGNERLAKTYLPKRKRAREFAQALDRSFAIRDEVKSLARDDTFVCRCEDVPYTSITDHDHWRSAKLHTRMGMGACQGKICGDISRVLFAWDKGCPRDPLQPLKIGTYKQLVQEQVSSLDKLSSS